MGGLLPLWNLGYRWPSLVRYRQIQSATTKSGYPTSSLYRQQSLYRIAITADTDQSTAGDFAIVIENIGRTQIITRALFVHGMGRSPLSGWPMLRRLRHAGFQTSSFGYVVTLESFRAIQARLEKRITEIAAGGDYVLVGHSLGGVLIRAALDSLGTTVRQPRHLFLLGTPLHPARLAQRLRPFAPFRWMTGDCGAFLASAERMSALAQAQIPVTSIVGTRGIDWKHGPFGGESNDGIVALSEVNADWLDDQVQLPTVHTLLPSNRQVAGIILERLNAPSKTRSSTPELP